MGEQSEWAKYTTGKEWCDKIQTTRKESGGRYSSAHITGVKRCSGAEQFNLGERRQEAS